MKKNIRIFPVLLLLLFLLAGCGSALPDLSQAGTDPNRFIWGSQEGVDVSAGDAGLFYVEGNLLRFYDTGAKQSYILCSKANCLHSSDKCNAYFKRSVWGESADSLAQIDGYLYCTYMTGASSIQELEDPKTEKAIQLLRIDPADGSRKVIASFPAKFNAAQKDERFYAVSISTVQYCGGYGWFTLDMRQPSTEEASGEGFTQLCGVELRTGQVVALNENDGYEYSFDAICADRVFFTRRRELVPILSREEFFENSDNKEFASYEDYWIWHSTNCAAEYESFAFQLSTGETQQIFSGTTTLIWGVQLPPSRVWGSFDGKAFCQEYLPDGDGNYDIHRFACTLLDLESKQEKTVLEMDGGSLLSIAQGYNSSLVFLDGTLFYALLREEGADIYVLDLNTGESRFLFRDDPAITFRIYGEYRGGFFGKMKDHQADMRFYWISKEDFYAGNLEAAVPYQL